MEQGHQHIFIHLGAKIANKNREFRTTIVTVKVLENALDATHKGRRNRNRESDRLSARPPPEAQLSLNGREVLGIMEPLRDNALAAAAGVVKSMKQ